MRKTVLDHGNILTVHQAVTVGGRLRPLPGGRLTGVSSWCHRDGRPSGSVSYAVEIHEAGAGTLTLDYQTNGAPARQVFALIGRPCRFGGRRWLARCPTTGKAVAKLYGCSGGFHSRHVLDASYRSQDRVPAGEKLRDREVAILLRLGADDRDQGDPPKPKWMRRPTYLRLLSELQACRYRHQLGLVSNFRRLVRDAERLLDSDPFERTVPANRHETGADGP